MPSTKKEKTEKYIFEKFKEWYSEFPVGKEVQGDSPDFIIWTPTGEKIGVEITEPIYDETKMSQHGFHRKFNEKVIEKLRRKLPFSFVLTIKLKNDTKPIRLTNKLLSDVADICYAEFNAVANHTYKIITNFDTDISQYPSIWQRSILAQGYRNLPDFIRSIKLGRFDSLTKSFTNSTQGGWVPRFTSNHLENILETKHKKLKKYTKCDQQWLLIWEGNYFLSHFDDVDISTSLHSTFDKIFFSGVWLREVIVIK